MNVLLAVFYQKVVNFVILCSYCEYQDLKMARQIKKRSRHGGIRKKKPRNRSNNCNESVESQRTAFPADARSIIGILKK